MIVFVLYPSMKLNKNARKSKYMYIFTKVNLEANKMLSEGNTIFGILQSWRCFPQTQLPGMCDCVVSLPIPSQGTAVQKIAGELGLERI